jgi:hypothetical protein
MMVQEVVSFLLVEAVGNSIVCAYRHMTGLQPIDPK